MAKYAIDESTLKNLANAIRKVNGETKSYTPTEMIEAVTNIMESATYILVDEAGNEVPAVYVDSEMVFTATPNDIREGTTAVTNDGVTVGEKFIPPYYTSAGYRIIPNGSEFTLPLSIRDAYDYTALQCIICDYNTSLSNSVAATSVAIDDRVYPSNSTESISEVVKDSTAKTVKLGIINDTGKPCIIRYFTYKEEE